MNRTPRRERVRWSPALATLVAVILLATTGACDEFSARRKIQQGGKLYDSGKFLDAAKLYEEALEIAPHLEIAHHNAGLAYYKVFLQVQTDPDAKDEEIQAYANKSAEHFAAYLETDPEDGAIIGLMTRIWLDSGQFEKALAYWGGRQAKDPKNPEVLGILASISRQAGDWEKAIEWHHAQADALDTPDGKVKVYLDVAKIIWHKLSNRQTVLGFERLKVADVGIATLQKAQKVTGASEEVMWEIEGYLASIFEFRALAHGASWARVTDRASSGFHRARWRDLKEDLDKKKRAAEEAERKAAGASGPAEQSGG